MKFRISLLSFAAGVAIAAGSAYAQDLVYPVDQDSRFNWKSYHDFADSHDLSGQTLSIFSPWLTADKDAFEKVLAYFEAATGAKVNHSGSDSFEQQIVIDTQAGSPANISVFPQPGLAADVASKGYLTPLGDKTKQWLLDNYAAGQSWVDLSSYKGKDGNVQLFSFPWKADLKSLVWYVPENFKEAGYEIPKTMEDLKALTEQIVKDGGTPWCIGLGSGAATGWPATDWVEDFMLRLNPPDVYDGWVDNSVPFNDPRVVKAIDEFGWFAKNDKFVDGGAAAVASTDFRDSPKGLFTSPPKCYMHRQASFIPAFFPDGTKLGTDVNFFYFPPYASEPDLGNPVLGAGTLFAITKDSPAAEAFVEFLETPIASEVAMASWNFFTPSKLVNTDVYPNDTLKGENAIIQNATTFRFDGSDQMPGKIGAGSFWTGMVDFVGGESAQQVADQIQKSWDAIK
jgi:alpha-glucoside transport system substrate-binding protein